MSCYIYQLPSWVLDDLCRNMDTLSEWDWMQFASYVITDLTQLRKIKSMERAQGVSITRELLWWWGMRQATVQQLLDLLCHLELYRAAQIILNWKPVLEVKSSIPDFSDTVKPGKPLAASVRNTEDKQETGQPVRPPTSPGSGPAAARVNLSASPEHASSSLKTNQTASADSKDFSASIPKQETLSSLAGDDLFWSEVDVIQATDNFNPSHKISEGTFADVYRGQKHGTPFIFKKLREMACSGPGSMEKFFQAEIQICRRCCHPNVLPLLGCCTGEQFYSLIYPYMANGSLQDRLQGQGGSDPLPWPQRISICSGLLHAVDHLHSLEIIHGNVKSSNVLLDQNFTPKLAHSMAYPCPVNRTSKYTMMKTHLFQASTAYLPEDFIRVGQLTKRVDIFSCGIVLAEVLTGIPAMDNNRNPVYLKDLLLHEIPSSITSLCSRKMGVEKEMAKEICQKYLEKRAGRLPEAHAEALVMAACLCLRRRNASLAEVCSSVAAVEEQLRGQETSLPCSGLSEGTGSSSNTPEETDDVDNSSFDASYSMRAAPWAGTASLPPLTVDEEGMLLAGGAVEADSSAEACAPPEPPQDATETSWKIEINEAKRKLMENILLYKEEKLDSIELFGP
ncbi:interleukin-1 receptor-associated kinase-like 2 isoform X2 [Bubalus bubalis]|uniref:interleukin-1 receptor-associated kinase-like 2 isoform X2 n=1 Tax=Bubalus bubalis TaxID=89462 RepID=UPI001E1B7DBE|nr:interleukin-1 receptor-associated kinase-like 2 isoform X2 [Bubalus bubalis]